MFRDHDIQTGQWAAERIFRSSGTTGSNHSRHFIRDLDLYHRAAVSCFEPFLGNPGRYTWIALLPSYLDRGDSSLVDMVHYFMTLQDHNGLRFFSVIDDALLRQMDLARENEEPTILVGVSFALLALFEQSEVPVWDNLIVMETGGMKGRGPEITRTELHSRLRRRHPDLSIVSEYGMTELMSQAYRRLDDFQPSPMMRVIARDLSDPLTLLEPGQRGVLNIIDLANVDTCAFIATDDLGVVYADESFEVLGRVDSSDLRGCNLMFGSEIVYRDMVEKTRI